MTMYKEIDNYMTPAEAVQLFGVSRKTLNSRLNSKSINDDIESGLIKKFISDGSERAQWIISKKFMFKYYGNKDIYSKFSPEKRKKIQEINEKIQENLSLMKNPNLHDLDFVRLSEQNIRLNTMRDEIKSSQD